MFWGQGLGPIGCLTPSVEQAQVCGVPLEYMCLRVGQWLHPLGPEWALQNTRVIDTSLLGVFRACFSCWSPATHLSSYEKVQRLKELRVVFFTLSARTWHHLLSQLSQSVLCNFSHFTSTGKSPLSSVSAFLKSHVYFGLCHVLSLETDFLTFGTSLLLMHDIQLSRHFLISTWCLF